MEKHLGRRENVVHCYPAALEQGIKICEGSILHGGWISGLGSRAFQVDTMHKQTRGTVGGM